MIGNGISKFSERFSNYAVSLKSASRELVQDILGFRNLSTKIGFFRLWAAGVSRVARKRSGSMPVLTGTRTHAVAVPPTLPEPGGAFNRCQSRETIPHPPTPGSGFGALVVSFGKIHEKSLNNQHEHRKSSI